MRNNTLPTRKITLLMTLMLVIFASVARVEAATPTLTAQQVEAVAAEVYNRFATFDVQQVVNQLTAAAEVEDEIATPPAPGTQTLIRRLSQQEKIKRLRELFDLTYFLEQMTRSQCGATDNHRLRRWDCRLRVGGE